MSTEIREILEQLEAIKESLKDLGNLMAEKCVGDYELTEDVFSSLYDLEYSIRDELEEAEPELDILDLCDEIKEFLRILSDRISDELSDSE